MRNGEVGDWKAENIKIHRIAREVASAPSCGQAAGPGELRRGRRGRCRVPSGSAAAASKPWMGDDGEAGVFEGLSARGGSKNKRPDVYRTCETYRRVTVTEGKVEEEGSRAGRFFLHRVLRRRRMERYRLCSTSP